MSTVVVSFMYIISTYNAIIQLFKKTLRLYFNKNNFSATQLMNFSVNFEQLRSIVYLVPILSAF